MLTAADLHAVKANPGDLNRLVFKKQRIRLADSEDLHVGAALEKLGVSFPNGLARAPQICVCAFCFIHDAVRGARVRLTLNAKRANPLQVPNKYVTGDVFGEPISDARINAVLKEYKEYFNKPVKQPPIKISLSDDNEGNDGGARGFSTGAGATTLREVVMDANTHTKSVGLAQNLQRKRNTVALQGYAEETRQLATARDEAAVETLLGIGKKRPRGDPVALEEMRQKAMKPEMMAQRPRPGASHSPPRVCPASPSKFVSSSHRSPPHRRRRTWAVRARRRHAENHAAEERRGQRACLAPAHRNRCLQAGRDDACDDGCEHREAPEHSPNHDRDGPRGRGRGAERSREARGVHGWRRGNRLFRRDGRTDRLRPEHVDHAPRRHRRDWAGSLASWKREPALGDRHRSGGARSGGNRRGARVSSIHATLLSLSPAHLTLFGSVSGRLARGGMLALALRTLRSTSSSPLSRTRKPRSASA